MHVEGHGIKIDCPPGWEAKIFRNDDPGRLAAAGRAARDGDEPAAPTLHTATFALPTDDGDWGTGAQELMGSADSLIVLKEFVVDSKLKPGEGLFAPRGTPRRLRRDDFHPRTLLRDLPGHSGYQTFFTENGRPFGLYVVLGGQDADLDGVNRVIDSAEIRPGHGVFA